MGTRGFDREFMRQGCRSRTIKLVKKWKKLTDNKQLALAA
tara:strand:+ start:13608 stop:13727 length:120 start_codon:yes stop_codon:yes gene_type:complete